MLLPGRNLVRLAGGGGARRALGGSRPADLRPGARSRGRALCGRHAAAARAVRHGGRVPGVAPPLGGRGGQSRRAGRLLRRRVRVPVADPGSLRGLARRHRPRLPRALWSPGRRLDPRLLHPGRGRRGRAVVDRVAAAHRRSISHEHFGVSLGYSPGAASPRWPRHPRNTGPGPPAGADHPRRRPGPAPDDRALPRGRLLEVRPAPDGPAGGLAPEIERWPARWAICRHDQARDVICHARPPP